jgi:hypothetical protein
MFASSPCPPSPLPSGSRFERAEGARESDGVPGDTAGRKSEAMRRMEMTRTKFDRLRSIGIAAEQVCGG